MSRVYVDYLKKEFNLGKLEKEFGTYEHKGKPLYLIQDSYPSNICGHELEYTAVAIDNNGNMYHVIWEMIDPDAEDGADTCNWDEYSVKEYIR